MVPAEKNQILTMTLEPFEEKKLTTWWEDVYDLYVFEELYITKAKKYQQKKEQRKTWTPL